MSTSAELLVARVGARLPDAPMVVALSGGADSAVLAWAISRSTDRVRTVSVDHGLPGSGALMEAAASIAAVVGVPHQIVTAEPSAASETALRETRYAALLATTDDSEVIATGHTLDDQAETVLGNMVRGAGAAGLSGIPPARGQLLRPMLDVARCEVRDLAVELGLPFVDDPQNVDMTVRRNQLRHETIPALAAAFNPRLVEALGRVAANAEADEAVLEARASSVPLTLRDGAVLVPAASLFTLPRAVAARVARRALRNARGPYAGTTDEIAAVLDAVHGTATTIGGAIDVHREGPWVVLVCEEPVLSEPIEIEVGSEVAFGGWTVSAEIGSQSIGRFGVTLNRPDRLVVRTAPADERIAISDGSKRVGDVLAEAGVPRRLRPMWPIVEADGTIVWIAGARAAPPVPGASLITVRARRNRASR